MILTTERTDFTEKVTEEELNRLTGEIVDCALQVHKMLGPSLLESAYQQALAYMFAKREIFFEKEKMISIKIDDFPIDAGYRADFIFKYGIILETKSVEKLLPIHDSQILTYMKLGGYGIGLLINFNQQLLKDGIKRFRL